jgi:hypothetical protein
VVQRDPGKENTMTDDRQVHSRLGASGAERWMNCPGSVALFKLIGIVEESDEPDFRREGIAGHEAAAHCLVAGKDAWEIVGDTYHETVMTPALVDPLQTYLDYCRSIKGEAYVEYAISSPVHPLFYGTADHAVDGPEGFAITDLKMGEGILVEVENNPQIMYYAFGFLDGLERSIGMNIGDARPVRLAVVQPRGHHPDGPVRTWDTTVGEIKAWTHGILVPAMLDAEQEDRLEAGEHCRFCPAKLICPLLTGLFKAACVANPKHIPQLDDDRIGLEYKQLEGVKFYMKALGEEVQQRLTKGRDVEGAKLVRKKSNRILKDGAVQLAEAKWGHEKVFTTPEPKSPAELDKLDGGKDWTKQWAYSPDTGLTVALASDPRPAFKAASTTQIFKGAAEPLPEE